MKHAAAVLSIIIAVLVGLFLPAGIFALQDLNLKGDEEPEIQQVDFAVLSGLGIVEKMGMLSDSESTLLDIGVGRYQTPETLSQCSWAVFGGLSAYGCPVIETDSAVQIEQSASLVSNGDAAFIFWRVLFTDDSGTLVNLYFDDETGLPLGLSLSSEAMLYAPTDVWAQTAMQWIADYSGLELREESGSFTAQADGTGAEEQAAVSPENEIPAEEAMKEASYPSGSMSFLVCYGDQEARIELRVGNGWFDVNGSLVA